MKKKTEDEDLVAPNEHDANFDEYHEEASINLDVDPAQNSVSTATATVLSQFEVLGQKFTMNLKEDKKTQNEKKSNFIQCCKTDFITKREILIHYSMAHYNKELLMTYGNKANCEDCNNRKGR